MLCGGTSALLVLERLDALLGVGQPLVDLGAAVQPVLEPVGEVVPVVRTRIVDPLLQPRGGTGGVDVPRGPRLDPVDPADQCGYALLTDPARLLGTQRDRTGRRFGCGVSGRGPRTGEKQTGRREQRPGQVDGAHVLSLCSVDGADRVVGSVDGPREA